MSTKSTRRMNSSKITEIAHKKGLSEEELIQLAKSTLGKLGGQSGTGANKRRPPGHYRKMVEERNKQRKKAKAAKAVTA